MNDAWSEFDKVLRENRALRVDVERKDEALQAVIHFWGSDPLAFGDKATVTSLAGQFGRAADICRAALAPAQPPKPCEHSWGETTGGNRGTCMLCGAPPPTHASPSPTEPSPDDECRRCGNTRSLHYACGELDDHDFDPKAKAAEPSAEKAEMVRRIQVFDPKFKAEGLDLPSAVGAKCLHGLLHWWVETVLPGQEMCSHCRRLRREPAPSETEAKTSARIAEAMRKSEPLVKDALRRGREMTALAERLSSEGYHEPAPDVAKERYEKEGGCLGCWTLDTAVQQLQAENSELKRRLEEQTGNVEQVSLAHQYERDRRLRAEERITKAIEALKNGKSWAECGRAALAILEGKQLATP